MELFINIDKLIVKHKLNKTNVIDLLKNLNYIYSKDENTLVSNNINIIIKSNKKIDINLNFFYKDLILNSKFSDIVITSNINKPIHDIKDKIIKIKKLNEASKKRLLFLDFEFVANQYYEVAYQIVDNGITIQKGYFFEEKSLATQYFSDDGKYNNILRIANKTNQLKQNKKLDKFDILSRNKINYILSNIIENVDYMIAHHINSELYILKHNDINIDKNKCICTDKLFNTEMISKNKFGHKKTSLSLTDIIEFFNIKLDISKLHYAYYDVELLKEVFFNIVNHYNKN